MKRIVTFGLLLSAATAIWAQISKCDVNYDGEINTADVTAIYNRIISGEEPQKPETADDLTYVTININGVNYKMVLVEAGTFMMGKTFDGDSRNESALPVHQVTLTDDYWIGRTEVTQQLWEAVMGKENNNSPRKYPYHPVSRVSYYQAVIFCMKVYSLLKDGLPEGMYVRLPYEAEWEYAARGGKYSKGCLYSGSDHMDDVGWCYFNSLMYDSADEAGADENITFRIHRVGDKFPNELGIWDMSGNVEEWCIDLYGPYSSGAQTNPTGSSSGEEGVLRGGSPMTYPDKLIDSYYYFTNTVFTRNYLDRNKDGAYTGLRLVIGKYI